MLQKKSLTACSLTLGEVKRQALQQGTKHTPSQLHVHHKTKANCHGPTGTPALHTQEAKSPKIIDASEFKRCIMHGAFKMHYQNR
jgi:hypothetical protein